jgi:hypothetical protein
LKVISSLCLTAIAAALVVAGCGGGSSNDTLSYSDFGSQASAICKDGNEAVQKLTDPSQIGPTIQPFIDKIKDLKAPDELKSAQDEFVSITQQQIDAPTPKAAQALQSASDAAGSKMGAPDCVTGS